MFEEENPYIKISYGIGIGIEDKVEGRETSFTGKFRNLYGSIRKEKKNLLLRI